MMPSKEKSLSSMAEEMEKEKPKFVCKLCKLDYPTSVQFEEHLWSMLHHKAINNKSSSTCTKHHCNLCMFESLDLNAYGKHLIGDRHKRSLVERRKRLEDPRQIKPTGFATSCSRRPESQTEHGATQRITSTGWNTPARTIPNQACFQHGGYSQSQGPNTFHQASRSNINYHYGGQFRHNQADWQQTHQPYSWRPPHARFQQPNRGSWENKSHMLNQKHRFPTSAPSVTQQNETSLKRPIVQGKVVKKNQEKYQTLTKQDNVTSTVNSKKAPQHSVGSQGLSALGSHSQTPSNRHVPGEKSLSDSIKKDTRFQSVPDVKAPRGLTSSKAQKKKKKMKQSPKIKSNQDKTEHTGSTFKPIKGKFARKKNPSKTNPSAACRQLPIKQKVQEPQKINYHPLSSEVASTKHFAPSINNAGSTRTFPTSTVDRFKMRLHEALNRKVYVSDDKVVEVTLSNVVSVPEKPADHSEILLTPISPMVSSTATVSSIQTMHEQNKKRFEKVSYPPHAQTSSPPDVKTSKIQPQTESLTSTNRASVSDMSARHLSTLRKSSFPQVKAEAVSSFHSRHEQNGKWSAEIRCATSSDKFSSKIHSCMESSATSAYSQDLKISSSSADNNSKYNELVKNKDGENPTRGSCVKNTRSSSSAADNSSKHKELIRSKDGEAMIDKTDKLAPKICSRMESSTRGSYVQDVGPSSSAADNNSKHKELVTNKNRETMIDKTDKLACKIQSHMESSTTGSFVQDLGLSSSIGTMDNSSKHREPLTNKYGQDTKPSSSTADNGSKEPVQNRDGETMIAKTDKLVSKIHCHMETATQGSNGQDIKPSSSTTDNSSKHKELVQNRDGENMTDELNTEFPVFARSPSSPATLPMEAQNRELNAGNEPLLSKVLVNEQQKQKLNPRPNLTNARTRLRINKDAEQPPGGQIFKEKIQGLLSDVAKPVWQQKKLRMMLAKAKKAPDRFNRFSHLVSSPSRSEDSVDGLDIMNLSTEFQQELLDLIQNEDADEEDILSQLTAPDVSNTRETCQREFVGGNTLGESLEPLQRHAEGLFGNIQQVVPRSTAPIVKIEPPDVAFSHAFHCSQGFEQLLNEGHCHQVQSSSKESHDHLPKSELDTHAFQPCEFYEGQCHQGISSRKPDERPYEIGSSERHDTSVTSTSAILPMNVIDSIEATGERKKAHKKKKKKTKKSKLKDRNLSPAKEARNRLLQQTTPKLKTPKSASMGRAPIQSIISGRVNRRTKSPTVLTANKLKKKFKQKRKMLDTMVGDMSSLLEITLQENKLQAKMDKLTTKIDKVVEIIQEKEAMLKIFKQEKEMVISCLADLRDKRLNLLLGLTSNEKSGKSVSSMEKQDGSSTDDGPSSSNQSQLSCRRGTSLQSDRQHADMSDAVNEAAQSRGESDIRISNVTSMAQATPSHRTEGFRIMFGSPTRPEVDQGHGTMDFFGDVGCNQAGLGIDIGSPPQSHIGQSIEVVPQVMSRESLAKTLQKLNSCVGGVKVDILSDEETTLYGIDNERFMNRESRPPSSDVIGAVAKLVNTNVLPPGRDSMTQSMGLSTVSDFHGEQLPVDSDQVKVKQERTGEHRGQETFPLRSDTEEGSSVIVSPYRNVTSSETSLRKIKQEPQDNYDISQETVEIRDNEKQREPSSMKRKRWKEGSEVTQSKRPKHTPTDPILTNMKQTAALPETSSSAYPSEHENTLISQMEQTHNYQSKVSSASYPSGLMGSIHDNPSETSVGLKKCSGESNTSQQQQSAQDAGDASQQDKATSSPRAKGYVINMCIILDKLYACISDSRFIIFNLKTNKIDAEEDLALGNIKHFELWRDTTARKMVAFASNGSRNLVQFDVQGKEFLQTLVLGKEITCLHVKWNSLYAGLVDGDIANIGVQKSKVSWYYTCTPAFAVTAISSTLEGGMGLLITASEDHTVTIRRADDGLLLRSLDGHLDVVTHLQVLGCRVLSMARNNTILLHDLETGDPIRRVKHQTKMACCVMSGDTLAVAGHTGNVYYYKIETGQADIFDSGCGDITCMTASQDMLFLGIKDGFIDVIPLYPSAIYQCEWSHCISRFLRVDALKTHLQHIHIRRSARQCLWKTCLKNYPQKNTTLKAIEQHVFSHLKDLGKP